MMAGVEARIENLNSVLSQTLKNRHRVLVTAAKNIRQWFIIISKVRAIYRKLNMFHFEHIRQRYTAEFLCPASHLHRIRAALDKGTRRSGSRVPAILRTQPQPPEGINKTPKRKVEWTSRRLFTE